MKKTKTNPKQFTIHWVSCDQLIKKSVNKAIIITFNLLAIVENILEVQPSLSLESCKQGLLQWLLKRIKVKGFDQNKLYAAEILSILLQNQDENRKILGDLNGIDILLHQIAVFTFK